MRKQSWRLVSVVSVLLLVSGCTQVSQSKTAASSMPTITPTASIDRNAVYTQAATYIQSFLDSWRKDGLYSAGQKYLDSSSRTNQKEGNPVLIAGTMTNLQQYSWVSADNFTVLVQFDLRFSTGFLEGDGGWGSGSNSRFFTFVRSSTSAPYRMTLNTGPPGPEENAAVYTEATAYLQSFLNSWQKIGFYASGQKYFDAVSKTRIQSQGNPSLVAGTVKSMQPYSWVSADNFMVEVDLDLRFTKDFSLGDGGWRSGGGNIQFITFKRSSASVPYQITLGTGP